METNYKRAKFKYNQYETLIREKVTIPTRAIEKWRRDTESDIIDKDILKRHSNLHWSSVNSKIRSFNCNFLNRNIPYNKRLKLMKKKEDDKCEYCDEIESIIHLYWNCPKKQIVWESYKQLFERVTGKTLELNKTNCLLGAGNNEQKDNKQTCQERLTSLLVKYYIHINKCNEDKATTTKGLELFIKKHLRMERECATRKGKINKYLEIWREWIPWMDGL
jgi:hypothetical protein